MLLKFDKQKNYMHYEFVTLCFNAASVLPSLLFNRAIVIR